jgi:hypothetical protein
MTYARVIQCPQHLFVYSVRANVCGTCQPLITTVRQYG